MERLKPKSDRERPGTLLITELAMMVNRAGTENPGYEAAIALDPGQKNCDCSSKCLFLVRENALYRFQKN